MRKHVVVLLAGALFLVLVAAVAFFPTWIPEAPPGHPAEQPAVLPPAEESEASPASEEVGQLPVIAGVVTDSAGAPLVGAGVTLVRRRRHRPDYEVLAKTVTNGEGEFRTPAPAPSADKDDYFFFEARLPGYVRTTHYLRKDVESVKIVMQSSRPLVVSVMGEESGEPVCEASIYVVAGGRTSFQRSTKTDGDGEARLSIPPGSASVTASAPGFVPARAAVKQGQGKVVLRLKKASRLYGRVLEKSTGLPLEGVKVKWGATEAVTASDGRFSLTGVYDGVRLELSGTWHRAESFSLQRVPPGRTFEREFALTPAGRISGRVFMADGSPADGAWVSTEWRFAGYRYMPGMKISRRAVLTDSKGRFTFSGVEAGQKRVFAARQGATAGVSSPFNVRNREEEIGVIVRLGRRSAAEVSVSAREGGPLTEIKIKFHHGKDDPWAPLEGLNPAAWGPPFIRASPKLTLEGLSGRAFELYVYADGYRPVALSERDLVPGSEVRHVKVVLERGLSISGILRDSDGRPLAGAVIHASLGGGHERGAKPFLCLHARTDDEGCFRVSGLGEHEYQVHATGPGSHRTKPVKVRAGADGIELR